MDDFERRRELRRQKREEMRLEAERIAYQRNDDDEEEAARERRRRARQERLRQKQEEEALGQVTDQVEVNAQNSVPAEEAKTTTPNTQGEGDDEAALLERLARREERRQKRLQEALERQKEFDPTITDAGLSLPSRRMENNTAENETAEKEEKSESRQERYEIEETEIITKSYQKNDWRDAEEKKEEKEKEEEEEEKPKQGSIEENQVEVLVEQKTAEAQEEVIIMPLKNGQLSTEEHKIDEEREQDSEEIALQQKMEEEERERAEAERVRLEAEEREKERLKAEQDKKIAEEKARMEAEEKARMEAEEKARIEAEEKARMEAEEKAAQERARREAEERERAKEEEERAKEEEKRAEERRRAKAEEEEKAKLEKQKLKKQLDEKRNETQEKKVEEKIGGKWANEKKVQEDKTQKAIPKKQVKDEKIKKDKEPKEVKSILDRKKGFTEVKTQNGEFMTHKLKHTENTFSRSGGRPSPEAKEAEAASQVEAGQRLEELRRRRGETESEEFEKLKQKQQEAALELEELKKKREERRKVLEEEEQKKKQEEAERKVREEEEKRRLKEEIERRRAEAAEKRQKMPEDSVSDDKKPFKCFTPKGSSLKIEERAEFLNKSVQKSSGVKSTHQAAVVSKIDSRLEQYTSAIEGTKSAKPTKPAASDLPVPAEGVRNIKTMWEKGKVFSSPTASGTPNKETAGLKVGVSSRINEWLTKTPDGSKSPAPKPSDLRPGDVSSKRNLWEKQSVDKVTSPTKV
ncbi:caldesmon isoform X4 [Elephas maximus indicus]|uniref:caldesmon isoform X4 n=1 Tax=Elephas maximus indicus TaxID=99487 RepID=UPI0021170191|nr:caldesmon isoform X4 [Elephas maximus indicus]